MGHVHAVVTARGPWRYDGSERPPFAVTPLPGQESVWDYPRPPVVVAEQREVVVRYEARELARSCLSVRVLETAGPPTFYVPESDIDLDALKELDRSSACEWKGFARYWRLAFGGTADGAVAWDYPNPKRGYEALRGYRAFYPGRVQCTVDAETVLPQPGGFYGGWITAEIAGPVKGAPGTEHW